MMRKGKFLKVQYLRFENIFGVSFSMFGILAELSKIYFIHKRIKSDNQITAVTCNYYFVISIKMVRCNLKNPLLCL